MKVRVPAVEAGVDQLDWAIKLFLNHQAFVPAITLALAAESLFSKGIAGCASAHATIKANLARKSSLTEREVATFMNRARDHLKHGSGTHQDGGDPEFDLEDEAIAAISRAVANLAPIENSITEECYRFIEWVKAERPRRIATDEGP